MDFGYGRAFTESSPEAYERLILDVLLGDPPLFPRHEEVELSWQILDPIEAYWAKQGKPEQYPAGTGARLGRRDDGRDGRVVEAAVISRPARAPRPRRRLSKKLVRLRNDGGAMALGRVLTLSSSSTSTTPSDAIEAANDASRQHPCRIIVVVAGNRRGPTGSTPRSGSAATPARARSSCCGSTARSPTTAGSVVIPLLLPDSPIVAWWPGEAPGRPGRDPIGAMAQRRITDAAECRNPRAALEAAGRRPTRRATPTSPGRGSPCGAGCSPRRSTSRRTSR